MGPHRNDLSAGRGRLLPGYHIGGNGDDDQHGRGYAGPNHVAGTLGKLLAAGGIVDFLRILME
jgi:hypothetical protein